MTYSCAQLAFYTLAVGLAQIARADALLPSAFDHRTDAWFDQANPDGTLVLPYANWVPATLQHEWTGISAHEHKEPGSSGIYSWFYEASDPTLSFHYLMNDFYGRTVDFAEVTRNDNHFDWWFGGKYYFVVVSGPSGAGPHPAEVWVDGVLTPGTGITGAYAFDISPNTATPHALYELTIPYDISPPERDIIRFRDMDNTGRWLGTLPDAGSTAVILLLALGGLGCTRKLIRS